MAREGRLARDVSTGLEPEPVPRTHLRVISGSTKTAVRDRMEERFAGKSIRRHMREFGATFALLFTIIAGFQARHPGRLGLAIALLATAPMLYALGIKAPNILYPLWKGWMFVGESIGSVMNKVILAVAWVLIAVPVGVALKVFGKKVMDLSFRAPVQTYWVDRDDAMSDFQLLERQY